MKTKFGLLAGATSFPREEFVLKNVPVSRSPNAPGHSTSASGPAGKTPIVRAPGRAGAGGGLLFLTWLIPGLGYLVIGRKGRAVSQFLMVMVTFCLGLCLHGGVAWPIWSPGVEGFNLINNLTFIIQLGAGLPALISLAAHSIDPAFAAYPSQHAVTFWTALGGIPHHAYYELGGYFMIVAGGINYFSVCNLYDRFIHPTERYQLQEQGEAAPETQS